MQVQIVSVQAVLAGRPSITWSGNVPGTTVADDPTAVNDFLFRFFSRIDVQDGKRLADLEYDLPSLAVGDLLHWGGQTWRVESAGWTKLTNNPDVARRIMLR